MIQAATAAHAPALATIHAAAAPHDCWDTPAMAALMAMPGLQGLIDPAGGFVLWRQAAGQADIVMIATVPAARRQGIARRLLDAAIAQAWADGVDTLFLEVAAGNLAAQGLYHAAGFVPVGLRRRYYPDGQDARLLRLDRADSDGISPSP